MQGQKLIRVVALRLSYLVHSAFLILKEDPS